MGDDVQASIFGCLLLYLLSGEEDEAGEYLSLPVPSGDQHRAAALENGREKLAEKKACSSGRTQAKEAKEKEEEEE